MKIKIWAMMVFCSLGSSLEAMDMAAFDMSASITSAGSSEFVMSPENSAKAHFLFDEKDSVHQRQAPQSPNKMGLYFDQETAETDQKTCSWLVRSVSSSSPTKGSPVKSTREYMSPLKIEALVGAILDSPEALSALVRHKKFAEYLSKNPGLIAAIKK